MPRPSAFLRDESGAASVDWVVLAALAAGAALTLAYAWGDAFTAASTQVAAETDRQGMTGGTYRAAMENYPPYNETLYQRLVDDFSSLGLDDLNEMERFVNAYYRQMEPHVGDNPANRGLLDDLDYAMGLAYARLDLSRPRDETAPDAQAVGRITGALGWDDGLIATAYQGASDDDYTVAEVPDFDWNG